MVEGDNFVFIHVPKTGGHSISTALGGRTVGDLHAKCREIRKRGRFAFGFVRNPFDRVVSMWSYMCQKRMVQAHNIPEQREAKKLGFAGWLLRGKPHWFFRNCAINSQMEWLDGCDYIGRFEQIESEFANIVSAHGIDAAPLQKLNISKHSDYRLYYDEETENFISRCAAPEIERFGYTFNAV